MIDDHRRLESAGKRMIVLSRLPRPSPDRCRQQLGELVDRPAALADTAPGLPVEPPADVGERRGGDRRSRDHTANEGPCRVAVHGALMRTRTSGAETGGTIAGDGPHAR